MKTGMSSLSGESLIQSIRDHFKLVKDHRDQRRIRIPLSDFLMAGFSIFALKFSSLLEFEEEMREKGYVSRLGPLFQLSEVPSDTQLRSVLDDIDPETSLSPIFKKLFAKAQRSKLLRDFEFLHGKYLLSVDGTQTFSSDCVSCKSCLSKRQVVDGSDQVLYYHQILAGSLVHPDQSCVIPLCPEPLLKQDGSSKNDSERAAMKRFIEKLRRDHPKLPLILVADALHATGPLIRDLELSEIDYIISVKPGSHDTLFAGVEKWDERGQLKYFTQEEEIGDKVKKKRIHEFRFTNRILLFQNDLNRATNFFEYWETTQWVDPKGRLQSEKKHFSWITNIEINEANLFPLMRGGRARWKIENETFNTLKNQGYEFEHNFGHGTKNLSTIFTYLMMLAFLFDELQQIGCKLFQKALLFHKRKKYFWKTLKGVFIQSYYFDVIFSSWTEFIERTIGPPENNSA